MSSAKERYLEAARKNKEITPTDEGYKTIDKGGKCVTRVKLKKNRVECFIIMY